MAIGNLGKLSVFLDVDMTGFVAGMTTASMQLKGLAATITRNSAVFTALGRNMLIAGGLIVAGLGFATKAAADFEYGMAKVNTMLKDSEQKYMPKFATQLRKMATNYGQSMKTLTDGTYDVLSAQMGAAKAMEFMETASKAAVGGFTDTKTAVSAMLTVMKTFKGQVTSAADAADFLHGVVERGRITFPELANSIGATASMAAKAGMTIEDFGAAIAVLTKGGLDASKTQTALRGILRSVLKTQAEGVAVGKELGVTWAVDAIRGGKFTETMMKLKDASIEQLTALAPNIRGLLGLAVAAGNAEEGIDDMNEIMKRTGLTQKKFDIANETLTHQMDRLKAVFNDSRIAIGEKLIPSLKDLIEKLIDITGRITEFADAHPDLFNWLVKTTAKVGLFSVALGVLLTILPKVAIAIGGVGTALGILAANPAWALLIATVILYKNLLNLQNAIVGVVKENNNLKDVEKMRLDGVNKSYEIYNNLLEDAKTNMDEMSSAGTLIPHDLKVAYDNLELGIQLYKEGKVELESLVTTMEIYIAVRAKMANADVDLGKIVVDDLTKVISLRESDYASYRKIADIKNQINLMGLEGVEKENAAETYRHTARLEYIAEEYKTKQAVAIQLTELENQLHSVIIKNIKDQKDMTVQMLKTLESSFQSTFAGALKGQVASFRDFFDNIVDSMRSRWADMVAEMVTNWIRAQFTMRQASSGSNVGSWLSIIGGLVGLGGVAAGASSGALLNATPGDLGGLGYTGIPAGYASGGMVPATGMYQLHEGEEVITREPNGGGAVTIVNVLDASLVTAMMGSASGQKVIVNTISSDILKNGITRKTMKGGL